MFCSQCLQDYDYTIAHTFLFGEEEGLVRRFLADYPEQPVRIIVCGNLETLHFVINGIAGMKEVELGFFPCDGDYDFYSTFPDVAIKSLSSLEEIIMGRVLDMDLLKVNDRYCINVANLGIDAHVARLRYKLVSIAKRIPFISIRKKLLLTAARIGAVLLDAPSTSVTMRINGYETIHDSYTLILFANTKKYGSGYLCAPQAVSDDGLIDVIHARRMPLMMMPRAAEILRKGDVLTNDYLHNYINYRRCCSVMVDVQSPAYISMDSTAYLCDKHFSIGILPAALRILVPLPRDPSIKEDTTVPSLQRTKAHQRTKVLAIQR
ncbi:MAG: diacylglycerol/lipid kinase family protein [Thermoguttaceae bacterium]